MPDIYQGTEFWDLSLVDPDNRRPVDFAARQAALAGLEAESPEALLQDWASGARQAAAAARPGSRTAAAIRRCSPKANTCRLA